MFFLNSRYTEGNASQSILEFLDLIRTNDLEKPYDKELEVSYMTIAQKMLDERRMGFKEGRVEGRAEMASESIAALKGLLEPAIIAEKFKMPLEQVLKILEQA